MNEADLLLHWLAGFRRIRRARLLAGVQRIMVPPVPATDEREKQRERKKWQRTMYGFLRLGHLEQADRSTWEVIEPTIVVPEFGSRVGYLVGARTPQLRQDIEAFPGVSISEHPGAGGGPSVWRIEDRKQPLRDLVLDGGTTVRLAIDRGAELLASLPPLSDALSNAEREPMPAEVECWRTETHRSIGAWNQSKDSSGPGLYRSTIQRPHPVFYRTKPHAASVRLDTIERKQAVAFCLLCQDGRTAVLDATHRRLTIPQGPFGLPLLVERALILPSGRLPVWSNDGLTYEELTPRMARDAARILGLALETTR